MKTYYVDLPNGECREFSAQRRAMRWLREYWGEPRLYRGAEYVTDRNTGGRFYDPEKVISVYALDIWRDRDSARRQTSTMADAVIARATE